MPLFKQVRDLVILLGIMTSSEAMSHCPFVNPLTFPNRFLILCLKRAGSEMRHPDQRTDRFNDIQHSRVLGELLRE